MKKLSALLALWVLLFAGLALANTATITAARGTVQAQAGTAPARVLRVGDLVRQGDTVITGAASSAVLRFEDGQVSALTANSRMTITAYQYNPQTQSGNILLSLIDGGMRAITGLIGNRTPSNVAYRAASATIGIRGTDVTIVTAQGNVVVTVNAGVISFQRVNVTTGQPIGQPTTVNAGEAAAALASGQVSTGTAAEVAATVAAALPPAISAELQASTSAMDQLAGAIQAAASGTATTVNVPTTPVVQQPSGGIGASCTGQDCTCPPPFVLQPGGNICICPPGQIISGGTCQPGPG